MARVDQLDQPRAVDMGVDLRRRDVGMAEQRLQHAQVRAARQQVRRKGVAQDVRADPLRARCPASAAISRTIWNRRTRLRWDLPLGNSHGLLPAHARSQRSTAASARERNRHQPLLVALAAKDQERLARPHRAPRQRHQLGRAQARAVKQFEQREVAQRQRLAARRAVLDRGEHRLDFVRRRDLGQRPLSARPRQRRRRIVAAQALVEQEAVETPQRRRSPRHRRGRELAQSLAEPRQRSSACRIAERRRATSAAAFEVAAIGGQRVARGARLGRHHVEEAIDQRSIARGHAMSRARERLGGDHPRDEVLPRRLQRGYRMVKVRGRNCIEARRLQPGSSQH